MCEKRRKPLSGIITFVLKLSKFLNINEFMTRGELMPKSMKPMTPRIIYVSVTHVTRVKTNLLICLFL